VEGTRLNFPCMAKKPKRLHLNHRKKEDENFPITIVFGRREGKRGGEALLFAGVQKKESRIITSAQGACYFFKGKKKEKSPAVTAVS